MTDGTAGQGADAASPRGAHAAPSAAVPDSRAYPGQGREGYQVEPGAAPTSTVSSAETPELKYMRETRNAAVFIAVVVGIVATLSLIATIIVGVQLSKLNNSISGGGTSSNCLSQGGTDPSC